MSSTRPFPVHSRRRPPLPGRDNDNDKNNHNTRSRNSRGKSRRRGSPKRRRMCSSPPTTPFPAGSIARSRPSAMRRNNDRSHNNPNKNKDNQSSTYPQQRRNSKKKKGKKAAVPADPSSLSGAGASLLTASTSTEGGARSEPAPAPGGKAKKALVPASANVADALDERWTRVEARRKKVSALPQDGLDKLQMAEAADLTTSDAGITTSATGNSSPVTERTTEDELPSELEGSVQEVSPSSFQDAPPHVLPIRPLPGERPAKGFTWDDYEGVQVDEDASGEEDGGWGVVRSRRRPNKATLDGGTANATMTATSQSQAQTKKQRQNAQRREALKEVKREREAQQEVAFATHKRELERARIAEQPAAPKRTGSRFDSLG
ncbi:hypothetical protein F5148DRAFT_169513 [Russula earlei]|uniref:Uncharacterized protein n=1 Tax=Russula earlei TaxID=71964 RepID=A0ACC0U6R4_9AGAM|nr:hypothetical protein F5148DRAFT_169513 [Russula earlei]